MESFQRGRQMQVGWVKLEIFDQNEYIAVRRKRCKIWHIYYGMLIRSRMCSVERYHVHWPWITHNYFKQFHIVNFGSHFYLLNGWIDCLQSSYRGWKWRGWLRIRNHPKREGTQSHVTCFILAVASASHDKLSPKGYVIRVTLRISKTSGKSLETVQERVPNDLQETVCGLSNYQWPWVILKVI